MTFSKYLSTFSLVIIQIICLLKQRSRNLYRLFCISSSLDKHLLRICCKLDAVLGGTNTVSLKDGCISHDELGYAAITNNPLNLCGLKQKRFVLCAAFSSWVI